MASRSQHNESHLLRLPTELLIQIVKELRFVKVLLTDEYPYLDIIHHGPDTTLYRDTRIVKEASQDLKSLRLTKRTFADFPGLKNILFRNIENLRNSQESPEPFSYENLESCYDAYMNDARDTQVLLKNPEGELKKAWTEIHKVLGDRIEKVKLLSYACEKIRQVKYLDALKMENIDIPWQLPPHGLVNEWSVFGFHKEHADPTVDYLCKQATAVTGDKLIAMVFTCLAASGVAIPNLIIHKLKVLHISPEIPSGEIGLVERYIWAFRLNLHPEKMKIKRGNFCHNLLDKCHSSIQHFAYGIDHTGRGVLSWPTQRPTHDFPELTHLTQKADTSPQALAPWLLHLKNLKRLDLSGDLCRGQFLVDWHYVFSAIGRHPNVSGEIPKGLRVNIDDLNMIQDELSYSGVVCKDVNIATKRHGRDMSLKHWENVNYGIEAHFFDEIPFQENKALLYRMGCWYPRDQEEDESDSCELDSGVFCRITLLAR
ncbi:unnamed protein product [Fusarium venenatum]|uniref:Uncharacterized protein n=1 Tax=Fusarium venenatum TaxID=56646 RepID=A0A2L2THT9_9HYPO|nr:uncharacterized protein FVRRES_10611 [Fusarium venenatum]CEI70534.1 unnamed protein product [Fusarium venenatum]